MCYMHDQPGWQKSVLRLVGVFIDGLCLRAEVPAARPAGFATRPAAAPASLVFASHIGAAAAGLIAAMLSPLAP
jgi:hypothetical protein